jgi:hypothetical protein
LVAQDTSKPAANTAMARPSFMSAFIESDGWSGQVLSYNGALQEMGLSAASLARTTQTIGLQFWARQVQPLATVTSWANCSKHSPLGRDGFLLRHPIAQPRTL